MTMTPTMVARAEKLRAEWKNEGGGYFSLIGYSPYSGALLAYVALPANHPDVGKEYDDLSPDVNGGLTFATDNVFGWDFAHAYNYGDPESDIAAALEYFRGRSATNVQPIGINDESASNGASVTSMESGT